MHDNSRCNASIINFIDIEESNTFELNGVVFFDIVKEIVLNETVEFSHALFINVIFEIIVRTKHWLRAKL